MARHLQLPADLDHPRAFAPQWLSDSHDHGGTAPQTINSALVDKQSGGGGVSKFAGWGPEEPKQERASWRVDDKPAEKRPWGASERFHAPQQERFVPQGRGRPAPNDHTPAPKTSDRWRDDGHSRWSHSTPNTDGQPAHWGSPAKGSPSDPLLGGESWSRQRAQRTTPAAGAGRSDTSRWNSGSTGWGGGGVGSEDHFPSRPWEGPKGGGGSSLFPEHSRDGLSAGRGRGFQSFGRGRGLGKDGGGYQRWAPSQSAAVGEPPAGAAPRGDDIIVPKLGTGPQRHKYTVEQMLSIYAAWCERTALGAPKGVDVGSLLDPDTPHNLLELVEAIAQQMVEDGFATKAERRLASRLDELLQKSKPPAPAQEPAVAAPEPQQDPREEQLGQQVQPVNAAPAAEQQPPAQPPEAEHDQWFYQDPSGNIQGPYTRHQILEWHDSGFFPKALPLSRTREGSNFTTLEHMLSIWRPAAVPAQPPPLPPSQQPPQQVQPRAASLVPEPHAARQPSQQLSAAANPLLPSHSLGGLPSHSLGGQPGFQGLGLNHHGLQPEHSYAPPPPQQQQHQHLAGMVGQQGQYRGGGSDLLSRLQAPHLSPPAHDSLASLMGALQMRHDPQPASLAALAQGLHGHPPFHQHPPPPQQQGLEELLPHLRLDHELAGAQHPYFDLPVSSQPYQGGAFPSRHPEPAPYMPQRPDLHVSEAQHQASPFSRPPPPLGADRQPSQPLPPAPQHQLPSIAPPNADPSPPAQDDDILFQVVHRQKKKETHEAKQAAPVSRAPQPPPPVERAPSPEPARLPTLGEAAGLQQPAPQEAPAQAPWASTPAGSGAKSLMDIQREEALQARNRASMEAAAAATVAATSTAAKGPGSWGKPLARRGPPVTSLEEIQEQERKRSAAGATGAAPPPPAQEKPPPSWGGAPARAPTLRDRLQASAPSQPARPPPARPAAKPAPPPPPAQEQEDDMFWDYGPSKATHSNGTAAKGARKSPQPAVEPVVIPPETSDGIESPLSPEFAAWCKAQLRSLRNGDDDLTLVQFLMTVGSNAEVAEYLTEYLGRTPAVSAFSNEFIKRKLVELNGRKKGRSRRAGAAAAAAADGKAKGAVGVAPVSAGGATGWSKMHKKKKKGQKMDAAMLGFETGTNYAALEKLEG